MFGTNTHLYIDILGGKPGTERLVVLVQNVAYLGDMPR